MQDDDQLDNFVADPELDVIEQAEVPFLADDILLAVMGSDGEVYVPIVPFCEHLGLGSPKHQVRSIRADEDMRDAMRLMPIATAGGVQEMQCLRVDMLTLWLGHIRRNAIKESARPILSRYKREAAKAILNHFMAKAATRKTMNAMERAATIVPERPLMPEPGAPFGEWATYYEALAVLYRNMEAQKTMLAQQQTRLDTHDEQIAGLSDDMVAVKEALAIMGEFAIDIRISATQASEIQQLVGKIKENTGLHQKTIYGAFNKQWQIPRYDELPAQHFETALEWLRQWGRARLLKKP